MTYLESIKYLESFINYEKIPEYPYKESLKLERIKDFLALLGNPHHSLKIIHIAGTKGKGSTCVFIAYILKAAGYKVGLYTSPHLSDFRERIRILCPHSLRNTKYEIRNTKQDFEGMISKSELTDLVDRLKTRIDRFNLKSEYGPLSFFEIYTSLAFMYFKEKKVDFVVIETGLGGRLDATNVVNPLVCGITPISYEHTQKLGNTLREIAAEKAGIIKSHQVTGSPAHQLIVISAPQEKEAREVIRKRCRVQKVRLYEVGRDIIYRKTKNGLSIKGICGQYNNLKISLIGAHQLINAAVAVGTIEALRFYNINIGVYTIRKGLYNAIWPGRCEVISKKPLIVLDGAQNSASSKALKEAISENFRYNRLILVFGISNDKDIKRVCEQLYGLADKVILTKADNPRATAPADLRQYFTNKEVYLSNNLKQAKKIALRLAKKGDLILVTGSLFILGEFRK